MSTAPDPGTADKSSFGFRGPFRIPFIVTPTLEFPRQLSRITTTVPAAVVHSQHGVQTMLDEHMAAIREGKAGLGYHYWICPDGAILAVRPPWLMGAHCKGHNNAAGICLGGDCRVHPPTPEQYRSLAELLQYLALGYDGFKVYLHRELNDTDRPGDLFWKHHCDLVLPVYWAKAPAV